MAPVVEVNRAYNLISSACKQSLSLGGEMMIEFTEACRFTFHGALRKYSHHFQQREAQLSWKPIVRKTKSAGEKGEKKEKQNGKSGAAISLHLLFNANLRSNYCV